MKKEINKNKGYVGILMLIITTLIIGIFFWRQDLVTGNKEGSKNEIEKGRMNIESAENAKDLIEKMSKKSAEEI